jgi:hypothetical protein
MKLQQPARSIGSSTTFRILAAAMTIMLSHRVSSAEESKVPVVISEGHDTDPKDGGRPVVLVAGAMEVKPEVFRQAFSGVTPARNGKPSGDEARKNKAALLKVLAPHGVTNERLDKVSDYYRYRPQDGELWPTTNAKAVAIVENGQIKRIEVTEPGAGYSSVPKMTVKGFEGVKLEATLSFHKDFKKNGAIDAIKVAAAKK